MEKFNADIVDIAHPNPEFRCNFCFGTGREAVYILKDLRLKIPGEWELNRCTTCGLLFLWPQPDWGELSKHYPQSYHGYIKNEKGWLIALRNIGIRRRVNKIKKYKPEIFTLLELGSATGEFLFYANQILKINGIGIEPVSFAANVARKKGVTVYTEDLIAKKFSDHSFDVIAYWDALEHIPDPLAHLQECYRILKSGGMLVIKTPDPSGGEAKIFKENWIGYEAPQHLFIFPKKVLTHRLEQIGFEVKYIDQIGTDYATFVRSLGIWLQNIGYSRIGHLLIRSLSFTVFKIIYGIIFTPVRKLGLKSSSTLFAFKPDR